MDIRSRQTATEALDRGVEQTGGYAANGAVSPGRSLTAEAGDNRNAGVTLQRLRGVASERPRRLDVGGVADEQVFGINLRTIPVEQTVGPSNANQQLPKPADNMKPHVDDLRVHLKAKDGIIHDLGKEIKKNLLETTQNRKEMDKVSQTADRDITMMRMRAKLQVPQGEARDSQNQRKKGAELQELIRKLKDEVAAKDVQSTAVLKSMRELEERAAQLSAELHECGERCHRQNKEILSLQQDKDTLLMKTQKHMMLDVYSLLPRKEVEMEAVQKFDGVHLEDLCQLHSSEEKVSSLGSEVGLLKSRLQEKTEQSQQLQDQVQKQQEALSRAYRTLKDTRKAAGSKISKKEMELGAVQRELLQVRAQFSECQQELLLRENLVQNLKEETAQLTAQIKEQSQDINKLNSERKKLELEMTVVMEKHGTAQREVSCRDQEVLQLKTDLKMVEEKLRSAQEERVRGGQALGANERPPQQVVQAALRERCRQAGGGLKREEREKENAERQLLVVQQQKQKSLLLQGQLDEARQELQKVRGAAQDHGLQVEELQNKAKQKDVLVRKCITEASILEQQIEKAQAELRESRAFAQNQELALDIFKRKYQSAMEKVQQQEAKIEALEEEVQYANSQVCQAQETVSSLRAEILSLERRYEEKCSHVENSEEAVEQLTEELQSNREDLRMSREQITECEQLLQKLGVRVSEQQKELSGRANAFLKLQSEMASYQMCHSYSNEEYKAQQRQCNLLREELESVKRQRCEQADRAAESQEVVEALKAEAASMGVQLRRREEENRALERTLQSLHLDVASTRQNHKVVLAQLEQEVGQLESDLADARRACIQKEQALRRRDDLLKRSEADLIEAREAMDNNTLELRRLQGAVEGLKMDAQVLQMDKKQKEEENVALRAEARKLNQELLELQRQHREMAQVLASREERLLLLESSLSATQEQLGGHVAEAVQRGQKARRTHAQLRSAQEEDDHLRQTADELQVESSSTKSSLQQALQEVLNHQRECQRAEVEHAKAREEAISLTHQLQQKEKLLQCLSEELGQQPDFSLDQWEQFSKLWRCMTDMEAEVERPKVKEMNDAHVLKDRESHISRLEEIAEIQEKHSRLPEEFLKTESRLTVSNLRTAATEPQRERRSEEKTPLQEARDSLSTCSRIFPTAEQAVVDLQQELSSVKERLLEAQETARRHEDRIAELTMQLDQTQGACQQNIRDLANKEEQLVILKTECEVLQDKLGCKVGEVEGLKTERCVLREKLEGVTAELKTEQQAAEEARAENACLHLDKEQLVSSVSRWIKEQKVASEGLAGKIKEQNNLLSFISAEKDHFQETKDAMEVELKKLRAMSNEKEKEIEHLKAQMIRDLSTNHQVLLNQLRGGLKVDKTEKVNQISQTLCKVEDMWSRLKANMEFIDLLNQQLSALSRENVNQREELEVERAHRTRLELMLQSAGQGSLSPRAPPERPLPCRSQPPLAEVDFPDLAAVSHLRHAPQCGPIGASKQEQAAALTRMDLEPARMKHTLEKSFWVQRVGELSSQLPESTQHRSGKMGELAGEMEQMQRGASSDK